MSEIAIARGKAASVYCERCKSCTIRSAVNATSAGAADGSFEIRIRAQAAA
jgi:hypothetical protein